ncbi:hypothetical protein LB545_29825 [Mesorhizobium sp. BR1-1-6]|uniref:hypothetical protein n=1 Tax=Mesorhizobium sp. BR1-1-6 TaxID=2876648 RepID=UPI001CD0E0E2|nr:hypothetical protein [Mesorhizobium sp. BR1-1-6]MBZ9898514.1 hypothetical protein [Mesorhizobium sp. BR1-1-6]
MKSEIMTEEGQKPTPSENVGKNQGNLIAWAVVFCLGLIVAWQLFGSAVFFFSVMTGNFAP